MKWRVLLALGAALLLVLPLTLLLLSRHWRPETVEGWRVLPMPSHERRMAMSPPVQMCESSAQCELPWVCFDDPRYPFPFCQASDCVSDAQCSETTACRSVPVEGEGVALRMCVPVGERKEGEPCRRLITADRSRWGCWAELACAGPGWCGRRCEPERAGSCPEGFFCARGDPEGPTCLPTCEGRGCPEGQQCVRHEGGVSTCAVVHGQNCQQVPCSEGFECELFAPETRPGEVWMQCLQVCEGGLDCPLHFSCHEGRCRPFCVSDAPSMCGADEACLEMSDEGYGVCLPSPPGQEE